ncbi:MAG: dockerin type I domain-containing protein [Chloroflexota bacterium]
MLHVNRLFTRTQRTVAVTVALAVCALLLTAHPAAAQITVVDDPEFGGGINTSMVLDATTGFPIIAYGADADDGFFSVTLKLAYCNDLVCTNPTIVTVDDGQNVGVYNSIQLNASGFPVIAYHDNQNDKLKLAVCNDATCSNPTLTTLDVAGEPGQYNTLVLGPNDYPIIAYYENDGRDLELVYCSDVNCATTPTVVVVDAGGWTGSYAEMVLNASGFPVISYRAQPGGRRGADELRLAVCNDATCTNPTFTTITNDGAFSDNSIVLDASGFPLITYSNPGTTGRPLVLVNCNDATCTTPSFTTVDFNNEASVTVGAFNTIVLDGGGLPLISYHDRTSGALKLAVCNDVTCSNPDVRIVDSGNSGADIGRFNSLVLDASGNALISYHDGVNDSLKLAVIEFNAPEVGVAVPPATVTAYTATVDIQVQYIDDVAINPASIDTNDIIVSGGATVTGAVTSDSGSIVTATYTVTGPGGDFDIFDNGTFSVSVAADEVADTSGNTVSAAVIIPAFEVNISRGSPYDVNADGVITPADAVYVVNRIGQTKNGNNAAADVNNDDVIDAADADLIVTQIGEALP